MQENLPENFIKSVQEYNKRLIKLNNDLFTITNSEKFKTFCDFIQHDLDLGKFSMYIFNHIENNDLDFENRIMNNDFSVFQDKSIQHHKIDIEMIHELQLQWSHIHSNNQKIIFKCIQNLITIANYVKNNYYDELLKLNIC